MTLQYYNADNNTPIKYRWICNYSFGALRDKFLNATGRKDIKDTKIFLTWCQKQGYLEKVEIL